MKLEECNATHLESIKRRTVTITEAFGDKKSYHAPRIFDLTSFLG